MSALTDCLRAGARELGLSLPEQAEAEFTRYYEFLMEKNRVMDLTAVTGEEETARRHFLDSPAGSAAGPAGPEAGADRGSRHRSPRR